MTEKITVDWFVFDKSPESTCYCKCGEVYRSHTKGVIVKGNCKIVSKKPCSECGENINNCYRITSDPETMTIKR